MDPSIPAYLSDACEVFPHVSSLLPNLQVPLVLLGAFIRRVLLEIVNFVSAVTNSIALLICYMYIKNFKRHSVIIVDAYVTIFKTFAEFISAIVCLCFGLMEVDFFYTALGIIGIVVGLLLKTLLLYNEHHKPSEAVRTLTYGCCGIYIMCVLTCSFAFHDVAMRIGVLPCLTRILTCVVPLVALSEFFFVSGPVGRYFAYLADFVALSVLWWYCAHLSLKYFVLVPSVIGLVFSFIQYVLVEIHRLTSKEIETDIYQRQ